MAKKSPKQPKSKPGAETAPNASATPPPAPKVDPATAKAMAKFMRESREIEFSIWRSING